MFQYCSSQLLYFFPAPCDIVRTLSVLSQLAVTNMGPCVSMNAQHRMGASCWATCWLSVPPLLTSYIRPALSQPTEKTWLPFLVHARSRTGAWCWYMAFGRDWPCELTSYNRTALSQEATARMSEVGEKRRRETESGGASPSSTSGLAGRKEVEIMTDEGRGCDVPRNVLTPLGPRLAAVKRFMERL